MAHTLVKAGLSAIPGGGPAAEFFTAIIAPPLSKRRDEWIESIAKELKVLEKKLTVLQLKNSPKTRHSLLQLCMRVK